MHYFFDLDGTLADTDCDIRLAWKTALASLGLESPDFDDKFVTGPPIEEVVRLLFPDRCGPQLVADARRAFGMAYDAGGFPNTREFPGVLDAVRALKNQGAHVLIATNKRYAGAKLMAEKFGWMDVFEKLYAGDMFLASGGEKMRKPELLAHAISELGANPDECVLVGDTASDFEAAAKNGVVSVAVTWGYGTAEEIAMADRVAHTPAEIACVRAIVSLGSNIEPRARYLQDALGALAALPGTRLKAKSRVVETDPVDVPEAYREAKFLNQVAIFETALTPHDFSRRMHAIEDALGRERTVRNGPRTIDIDLVDFGGMTCETPELTLPHSRAKARAFVTEPLAELGIMW